MPEITTTGPVRPAGPLRMIAGEDLSNDKGKAVKVSAGNVIKATAATDDAIGVLITGGPNGTEVTVAPFDCADGTYHVCAGAAIANAFTPLKFDATARFVAAVATDRASARNRVAASGAGALVEASLNRPTVI